MTLHKAAAWILLVTTMCLPATVQGKRKTNALAVTPQTIPTEPTVAELAEPPSTRVAYPPVERVIEKTRPTSIPPTNVPIQIKEDKKQISTPEPTKPRKNLERKQAQRIKHTPPPKKPQIRRSVQKLTASPSIIGKSNEQCVIYVRRISGNQKIRGYAGDLRPEGNVPRIGAGALERKYGHVSLVVGIQGEYITIHETNWVKGAITERTVHVSTQRGYIY